MSVAVLEISSACRSFADRQVLHDVSLRIDAGEILALLGPNGAGKTTLMRAATGRLALDSGTVRIAGQDPFADPAARRLLGLVPQTIALYAQLTCRQNLEVFARLIGLAGKQVAPAVDEALQRADLVARADDRVADLSGGMQRRLNIVTGTLHGPKLLLLDEATVGVDLAARDSIQGLLQQLRDAGMAILISTHDFEQAEQLADRAVILSAGKVLRTGVINNLVQEVFGGAREAVLSFHESPGQQVEALLKDFRMQPVGDGLTWSGPLVDDLESLGALETRLNENGIQVAEIGVRKPGLGGVYRQLTGAPS